MKLRIKLTKSSRTLDLEIINTLIKLYLNIPNQTESPLTSYYSNIMVTPNSPIYTRKLPRVGDYSLRIQRYRAAERLVYQPSGN